MKRKLKLIIDIIMYVLFIILMGYHLTNNKTHEILGVITFILFIIHHILNIRWYKTLFKGKYNFYRILQIIIDFLLLISMIGIIFSSIIISADVFSFLNIKTTMFGRNIHMISTSWSFVLMAIHLGLHLNIILFKLNKKMKNSIFEYVYYLILIILILLGIYYFIDSEIWKDMFLISQFKFFDYNQQPLVFYLGCILITCFVSLTTYFLVKKLK